MAIPTLSGSYIDETYGRLVQVSGSEFADGLGNPISFATTGSNVFRGNQTITGSLNVSSGITGSLQGTASWATSASYADNGGVTRLLAGSNITLSPSNGLGQVTITAAGGGGSTFPYSGNASITGSLSVSGSTGGLRLTGSFSQNVSTASFGGKVAIGLTNPQYTLDVSGSLQIATLPYYVGQKLNAYETIAYVYQSGDPLYYPEQQRTFTVLTGSVGRVEWTRNDNSFLGTYTSIGYAQSNYNTIYSFNSVSGGGAGISGTIANSQVLLNASSSINDYYNFFLPTKDELQKIWNNRALLGITAPPSGYFWSSTDINSTTAWAIEWSTGTFLNVSKRYYTNFDILLIKYNYFQYSPLNLQIDQSFVKIGNLQGGNQGNTLQYNPTTGIVTYTVNPTIPEIPTVPDAATVRQINEPDNAAVYIRPQELDQSKHTTINIFNYLNFS